MVQAVSWQSLTAGARFQSQVSPCKICGVQSGTVTVFFSQYFCFPCQYHSTNATYSSLPTCMPPRRTDAQSLGTFQNAVVIGHWEAFDRKVVTFFSLVFKRDVEWVNKPRDEAVTRDWEEANCADSDACGSLCVGLMWRAVWTALYVPADWQSSEGQ